MSDTPRTDELIKDARWPEDIPYVDINFARQLERELKECEEDRQRYKALFHEQELKNDKLEAELELLKSK